MNRANGTHRAPPTLTPRGSGVRLLGTQCHRPTRVPVSEPRDVHLATTLELLGYSALLVLGGVLLGLLAGGWVGLT